MQMEMKRRLCDDIGDGGQLHHVWTLADAVRRDAIT
jgi:hypothetical protein